jgi:hypothetical protein
MKLRDKIVDKFGEVFEAIGVMSTRDVWIFKNLNNNGTDIFLNSEAIQYLIGTGDVRLWKNGLERAVGIAKSRQRISL